MDRSLIEKQIEELLAVKMSATTLSQLLFSPAGLFNDLARFEPNRAAVTQLPLFRQAMTRFRELSDGDSAGLQQEVDQVNAALDRGRARAASTSTNGTPPTAAVLKAAEDSPV